MKPPDPTAAGTLNCTGVVPELFKFATGAIIKVAPRYQSHPILRYYKVGRCATIQPKIVNFCHNDGYRIIMITIGFKKYQIC
jgi:hypothetical protein